MAWFTVSRGMNDMKGQRRTSISPNESSFSCLAFGWHRHQLGVHPQFIWHNSSPYFHQERSADFCLADTLKTTFIISLQLFPNEIPEAMFLSQQSNTYNKQQTWPPLISVWYTVIKMNSLQKDGLGFALNWSQLKTEKITNSSKWVS